MDRQPLELDEAVRYFHGAERASGVLRERLLEQGVDASQAEALERIAAAYREALEQTKSLPGLPDSGTQPGSPA
jgi:hypothetical protein